MELDFFQNNEMRKEHEFTFKFVSKYIHRKVQRNLYEILMDDYDGFVVGSDQIWREHHYRPIENAYLDFTVGYDVKRIAYAASFGTDKWEYSKNQTENCSSLLKNFVFVGVREKSGVDLCKKHFGREAVHVLDPTLLLRSNDYINNLEIKSVPQSKGDFLVYILDMTEEKQKIVDYIAKKYNLTPFYVNSKCDDKRCALKERIQPPVENWLRGFYDAKYVFTDSFHACAFAINFNTPFWVFGNKERGMSRFESLLASFHLRNRLIGGLNEIIQCEISDIDWEKVNLQLSIERKKSISCLSDSLNK